MDCSESCRRGSLSFQFVLPWRKEPKLESIDLGRRGMIVAAIGGITALAAMRVSPQARGRTFNPALIRPPGARPEREFLQRCTSCGLCIKVCPTGGLQPTLTEAGLEGLWTPMLVPLIGCCDYTCNLCGQVCPTEAIVPLTLDEKHATRIGLASFDVTRCIPYAYGRNCMVCEEHCPIPDKAIYCLEVEIQDRNGEKKTIKRPYVDPQKCIGCGECEHVCPYKDRPAIRVTSANETRHPDNQPMLDGGEDYPSIY
jgi:MauM/NapG family ferredoxin protein